MIEGEHRSPSGWLEVVRQFPELETLLGTFAIRSGLMPEGAYRTPAPTELPENLRKVLSQGVAHASICFTHGTRFWVFTGTVCATLSRERRAPVLWVNAFSKEGTLIEAGAWAPDSDGKWRRCGDHVDL